MEEEARELREMELDLEWKNLLTQQAIEKQQLIEYLQEAAEQRAKGGKKKRKGKGKGKKKG